MLMRLFHPTLIEPTIRAVAYRLERRCTLAYSIYPIVESVAWDKVPSKSKIWANETYFDCR
jgi:hypothetical protein